MTAFPLSLDKRGGKACLRLYEYGFVKSRYSGKTGGQIIFNHWEKLNSGFRQKYGSTNFDDLVKSRHSSAGGNPESPKLLKRLDSRFHGIDGKSHFQTFYEIIIGIFLPRRTTKCFSFPERIRDFYI
jgi:hypothetical protein